MKFDVKQAIIDRLRATKRKNIEAVIDYMEKHCFFTYHCHRHHHYDGGLADHAWQTYQIAIRLDAERCTNNPNAQKLDEDSIAICALLHDFCDCSGMRDIKGHGIRSAIMLQELGLALSHEEYLAIRFHMSLKDKTTHPSYNDALKSQLRYVVHKADGKSAKLHNGYEDSYAKKVQKEDLMPYLQNITTIENKDFILRTDDGWHLNLHSAIDGEIEAKIKNKVIAVKNYDKAELNALNDSGFGAIYILCAEGRKGLFIIEKIDCGLQAAYYSPDKDPFIYSDIKIYSDWDKWNDYGYAACLQHNGWKLVKVTQFPKHKYKVIGEGFSSAEEAMKSIGIDDCEKYLSKRLIEDCED